MAKKKKTVLIVLVAIVVLTIIYFGMIMPARFTQKPLTSPNKKPIAAELINPTANNQQSATKTIKPNV